MSRYLFTRICECNDTSWHRVFYWNATVLSVVYRKLSIRSLWMWFSLCIVRRRNTGQYMYSVIGVCVWQYTFNDIMYTVRLVRARSFHKIRDFFLIPPLLRRRTQREFQLVSMWLYTYVNNVYWSATVYLFNILCSYNQ